MTGSSGQPQISYQKNFYQSSHFLDNPKLQGVFQVNSRLKWSFSRSTKRLLHHHFGNWQVNEMECFSKNKFEPLNLENSRFCPQNTRFFMLLNKFQSFSRHAKCKIQGFSGSMRTLNKRICFHFAHC